VKYIQQMLEQVGLGKDRVVMYNMSSAMAAAFAEAAAEFTGHIKALGPNPVGKLKSAGGKDDNS
jgi:F420-non-reducing hydrogenase iron-sulfur subunit